MTTTQIRTRASALFGIAALFGACGIASLTALPASAATATKITSATFSGSATAPTVTIRGSGFGKEPNTSPSGPPYRYLPGCTSQAPRGNKNDGHDFGAHALWVGWKNVQAGAYVAGAGGYLDCIGLIIKKYSATEIVISPGCQYGYYAKLTSGTDVTVTVSGHRFTAKALYS